ncbi:unnamed protein product, partial [Gongylonema pulchrum]|uniref:Ras-GEF domain-containing protein n=1 Tax=Gongylonema pulchrum TaxID=637853 RepID=A0A183F0H9_9BILA
IFQVLVRSVEARDWLSCAEPTSARAAVKHLIDNLAAINLAAKPFVGFRAMDEGTRKERILEGSCSSRSHSRRTFDSCSISSTLDKLWSERVDFCSNIEVRPILHINNTIPC